MKIVIAVDSFKGTLSSLDICHLFQQALKKERLINCLCLPIADGGEGSIEAISYTKKGIMHNVLCEDPYFNNINAPYFLDLDRNAYIETASCAGLNIIKQLNPLKTSTYGLAKQVLDALKKGSKKIYIFLGGSATNDGGCGLFAGLGTKFYNKQGESFIPTGATLIDIEHIDNRQTEQLLKDVEMIGMCDVDNPLYGLNGAAYVYGPQKGADHNMVNQLDEGLKNLGKIINKDLNKDVAYIKGAGAAGGLGASILAFANGDLSSGITTILGLVNFNQKIKDADYVITGEGRLDNQSFQGKVVAGVANACQNNDRKLILLVGSSTISLPQIQNNYPCIERLYETNPVHLPFEVIKDKATTMVKKTINELISDLLINKT